MNFNHFVNVDFLCADLLVGLKYNSRKILVFSVAECADSWRKLRYLFSDLHGLCEPELSLLSLLLGYLPLKLYLVPPLHPNGQATSGTASKQSNRNYDQHHIRRELFVVLINHQFLLKLRKNTGTL
jgi:hypothetical protein